MVFDLWKQIKAKKFTPIFLLYGAESFLINETKQLLISNVLSEAEMDFNLSSYDLEETAIDLALEDAETLPFMGEKRLIFLHNPVFLTSEKTKEKVEHNLAKLESYIKEPSPFTIIVFIANYEKLDERKKLTKELKRSASILEAKKLNEGELKAWIKERAAANDVEIDDQAAEYMLTLAGTNLFLLTSEIDKLALYCGAGKRIDMNIVERLVSRSLEQNIFTLVDKIIHRKIDEALRIFYDLLKQNEEPIKILAIITGQFRLIYQVKELARKGYGQQQIAGYLKVHPFRVKLAAGQAQLFGEKELTYIMKLLAEADYQMKTSSMKKELLIEMFLFRLKDPI
ncbi:DNA polymerase III subunit delta [Cytobacillus depressus]|uniref:DNA polymerase III subunit delta n=1 Tax=Cytobacillus depressus TaxID=1602942 RepID=A0A6L3VAC2_9BACI|nr:DNA polymerase III subunit delta [Cytobacillus depressus]KAB2338618.1 DNA polymerase III subunit delta [Cytobacillus depressus]